MNWSDCDDSSPVAAPAVVFGTFVLKLVKLLVAGLVLAVMVLVSL